MWIDRSACGNPFSAVGLTEAIPVDTILANTDENDSDVDGISGRHNWVIALYLVPPPEVGGGSGQQLGRFSRKAQVSSLVQQVAGSYPQGMAEITSECASCHTPTMRTGTHLVPQLSEKDLHGGRATDVDGDDQKRLTLGLNFRPTEDTVFKLGYHYNWLRDGFNLKARSAEFLFSAATNF